MQGGKAIEVKELHAGDLGALAKITAARTGNTLSTKSHIIRYGKVELPTPYTYKRYHAVNKGDVDKIAAFIESEAKSLVQSFISKIENADDWCNY